MRKRVAEMGVVRPVGESLRPGGPTGARNGKVGADETEV